MKEITYKHRKKKDHREERFLKEFKSYLHVDGYAGYDGMPNINIQDSDLLDVLLPWSDNLPSSCRVQI